MADSNWAAIEQALEAAYHIAECGDHPEHLLDAETKVRKALAAVGEAKRRESELEARLKQASGYVTEEFTEWADETAAHLDTKARAAELERALADVREVVRIWKSPRPHHQETLYLLEEVEGALGMRGEATGE